MAEHNHGAPLSDLQLRVKALEAVLSEKGLVDEATLDALSDHYEHKVGPHIGAQIVARAWTDPGFKKELLEDGSSAIAKLGFAGLEGTHMEVKENTPRVHNVVVCTLCSCYPWSTLGLPPTWYKSAPYRSRVVKDPRSVLQEFGVELGEEVEVRVWDSNADLRYMVLPRRPEGTDEMTLVQLAALVNRDSMIGTGQAQPVGTSENSGD
jgi:nitrile hydratase subunit alpha